MSVTSRASEVTQAGMSAKLKVLESKPACTPPRRFGGYTQSDICSLKAEVRRLNASSSIHTGIATHHVNETSPSKADDDQIDASVPDLSSESEVDTHVMRKNVQKNSGNDGYLSSSWEIIPHGS